MILDRLENACMYRPLGGIIGAALDYLQQTDLRKVPEGRHELDGDRLVAIVERYCTKPLAEARWEAHRQYVDVQCVVEGTECMGHASLREGLPILQPYDETRDLIFFDVRGSLFEVPAGSFVLFAPQDIHAPGLAAGAPPTVADVLKVVVKCRTDRGIAVGRA